MSASDDKYNRSAKGRARHRRYNAQRTDSRNERRVYVGRYYVGMTRTPETAAALNEETRKELHDRQNQSRA